MALKGTGKRQSTCFTSAADISQKSLITKPWDWEEVKGIFFFALMLTWQQVIRFKYKCFYYPVIRNIQELTWRLLWFGRPVLFYYGQDILVLGSSVERFCMVATEHRGHSLKFFTDHTNKAALFWYPIAVIFPFQSMCDTTERISLVAMTMWRQHWSVRTV